MCSQRPEWLGFVGGATAAAVVFGIAHDLVTANLSVEYFTVHHPTIIPSESPWVMALLWGFLATFWVGAIGGALVAGANLLGRAPSLPWSTIQRAMRVGLAVLWVAAMTALASIYTFAGTLPQFERRPTFEQDRRLVAVAFTHVFSYAGAAILILALMLWVAVKRHRSEA